MKEIAKELDATVYCCEDSLDTSVTRGAAADLMSDILRIPFDDVVLITGLNTIQAIRTCILTKMKAIILVRGRVPQEELISEARAHKIPVLSTKLSLFSTCGRLYAMGIRGIP